MDMEKFRLKDGTIDLHAAYVSYAKSQGKEIDSTAFTPGIDFLTMLSSVRAIGSRQAAAIAVCQAYVLDYPLGVH